VITFRVIAGLICLGGFAGHAFGQTVPIPTMAELDRLSRDNIRGSELLLKTTKAKPSGAQVTKPQRAATASGKTYETNTAGALSGSDTH